MPSSSAAAHLPLQVTMVLPQLPQLLPPHTKPLCSLPPWRRLRQRPVAAPLWCPTPLRASAAMAWRSQLTAHRLLQALPRLVAAMQSRRTLRQVALLLEAVCQT
jgi:hypothetical protein